MFSTFPHRFLRKNLRHVVKLPITLTNAMSQTPLNSSLLSVRATRSELASLKTLLFMIFLWLCQDTIPGEPQPTGKPIVGSTAENRDRGVIALLKRRQTRDCVAVTFFLNPLHNCSTPFICFSRRGLAPSPANCFYENPKVKKYKEKLQLASNPTESAVGQKRAVCTKIKATPPIILELGSKRDKNTLPSSP